MTGKLGKHGKDADLGAKGPALSVGEVVRRWPRERALAVVCGGGPAWGETLVGSPMGSLRVAAGSRWIGAVGAEAPFGTGNGAMEDLRTALAWGRQHGGGKATSGWVVSLSYELGEVIEPAVRRRLSRPGPWPLIELQRCEDVFTFSHTRGEWQGEIENALETMRDAEAAVVGELQSGMGRERFEAAVERAIEYIRAGDAYQVNLAHRLSSTFSGSTRAAFAALLESAQPWHGAYMEVADGANRAALMSASPELFLKVDGRSVMTRPMKGTLPADSSVSELRDSGKDRAELNMIIDLMRNDLGRVCRFGSVKVEDARAIERHGATKGGVWQGVGTVVGELRDGLDLVDLLAAAFPAGSVTGAPKIRAMQIIDELELSERGPYCGSMGWIGDDGRVCLNVAIRTACVRGKAGSGGLGDIAGGEISFRVGAGIVAESVPSREWQETLDKAGVMGCLGKRDV